MKRKREASPINDISCICETGYTALQFKHQCVELKSDETDCGVARASHTTIRRARKGNRDFQPRQSFSKVFHVQGRPVLEVQTPTLQSPTSTNVPELSAAVRETGGSSDRAALLRMDQTRQRFDSTKCNSTGTTSIHARNGLALAQSLSPARAAGSRQSPAGDLTEWHADELPTSESQSACSCFKGSFCPLWHTTTLQGPLQVPRPDQQWQAGATQSIQSVPTTLETLCFDRPEPQRHSASSSRSSSALGPTSIHRPASDASSTAGLTRSRPSLPAGAVQVATEPDAEPSPPAAALNASSSFWLTPPDILAVHTGTGGAFREDRRGATELHPDVDGHRRTHRHTHSHSDARFHQSLGLTGDDRAVTAIGQDFTDSAGWSGSGRADAVLTRPDPTAASSPAGSGARRVSGPSPSSSERTAGAFRTCRRRIRLNSDCLTAGAEWSPRSRAVTAAASTSCPGLRRQTVSPHDPLSAFQAACTISPLSRTSVIPRPSPTPPAGDGDAIVSAPDIHVALPFLQAVMHDQDDGSARSIFQASPTDLHRASSPASPGVLPGTRTAAGARQDSSGGGTAEGTAEGTASTGYCPPAMGRAPCRQASRPGPRRGRVYGRMSFAS